MPSTEWIRCTEQLPPEDQIVATKLHDEHGLRNEQLLKRRNKLWFVADGSMYVYYEPTHWHTIV